MMLPEDLFKKNVEMWEKFTKTYMENMFKTVERTMEQSQTFQTQVDQAVNKSFATQMQVTLDTLKALQRQVETLAEKVDQLVEKEK